MSKNEHKVTLKVSHLTQTFNLHKKNEVQAVKDISFSIYKGETFGLVGETGSGKSTTGRAIIKLYQPTSGEIIYQDQNITNAKEKQLKEFRKNVQMIFQDPYASLNPRMKVEDIIAEGIDNNKLANSKTEREKLVFDLLDQVGLNQEHASRYPFEFSGGQRQRIGIARALAVNPEFIIADEPVSALDVSIQAQVLNLLNELQKKRNLTYLFIAHDLAVVKYMSDRIGVMHNGRILELATSDELYHHPLHPYTRSLISAIPVPDPTYEKNRKIVNYDDAIEYDNKPRELREITPDHFVFSTKEESEIYQKATDQFIEL